jgi:ketosteroid isomerase-like protein
MPQKDVARYRVPAVRQVSRRTLLDRVALRFPAAARRLRAAVLRLPVGSRLRGAILARSIRDNAEAYSRRDYEVFALQFDPDVVIETRDVFPEDTIYQGPGALQRLPAMIEDVWSDYRIEPEVVVDLGDRYVLFARHRARGRGSGVDVDQRIGLVGTLGDGVAVRLHFYYSPDEALEAVGLRGPAAGEPTP